MPINVYTREGWERGSKETWEVQYASGALKQHEIEQTNDTAIICILSEPSLPYHAYWQGTWVGAFETLNEAVQRIRLLTQL